MSASTVPVLIAFNDAAFNDAAFNDAAFNDAAFNDAAFNDAAALPQAAHPGDAGRDLCATSTTILAPGQRATIGTGVSLALPHGYVGYVLPRSGLAARHGITVLNAPGTIDAGYRGEIAVTLLNTDTTHDFSIAVGDRIAQLVLQPVYTPAFTRVERLPGSARGAKGHGSTGGFGVSAAAPSSDALSTHQLKD